MMCEHGLNRTGLLPIASTVSVLQKTKSVRVARICTCRTGCSSEIYLTFSSPGSRICSSTQRMSLSCLTWAVYSQVFQVFW